jgi:RNA polymerase sigma-70 factor, ECF subfamily
MGITTDDVDLERDRRLVEECQSGRAAAFDELYARYHDRIVRHCARRLAGRADAEDVAQEAFLRAWRAIGRLEGGRRFYPWLHVIASNACTDLLRRERPTTPLADLVGAAEPDDGLWIDEQFATSVDAAFAAEALQMVTERHRRVLHLREELEWSVQEIAAHEGVEPNAIDSLLWRARASLRQKFTQLSEGVAAVFGLGTTRSLLARHRFARAVHRLHGNRTVLLPARATVAAVIAVGAVTASVPLLLPSAPHQQSAVAGRGNAGTAGGARPVDGGTGAGAPSGSGTAGQSGAASPVRPAYASSATPAAPGAAAPGGPVVAAANGGVPAAPVPAAGPLPQLQVSPLALAAPSAAVGTVTLLPPAVLAPTIGTVTTTTAGVTGAVQGAAGSSVIAPVVPPVLPPTVGGTVGGTGISLP